MLFPILLLLIPFFTVSFLYVLSNLLQRLFKLHGYAVRVHEYSGNSNSTRCPYCRNEIDFDVDVIVSCTSCFTHLHKACWDENSQCSTWGCRTAWSIIERPVRI